MVWDPTEAAPSDTSSTDNSKSGIRQAWDEWTSRPENNAALLQFGIAMLQPRAPGQSGIGQFANAIGEAGQASERNIAAQQAEAQQGFEQGIKSQEAAARTTTAKAYADQVKAAAGGKDKTGLQGLLRQQADFRRWLAKPEDQTGLTADPILAAIQKSFPDVKSKGDLLSNPAALSAARKLFSVASPSEDEEGDSGVAAPQASPAPAVPAAPAAQPRIIYDAQGKPYQWDGIQGHPPVPMQK